ncbi:unnamed protein product [Durusdinium trenchii]|uniref:Polycystin cation channel PKD1/PKD2 domain-containing protein n=1 Tax=Durusdinium trenchii TaxID=1381693 RepID=A0ABP0IDZ6_9DINO
MSAELSRASKPYRNPATNADSPPRHADSPLRKVTPLRAAVPPRPLAVLKRVQKTRVEQPWSERSSETGPPRRVPSVPAAYRARRAQASAAAVKAWGLPWKVFLRKRNRKDPAFARYVHEANKEASGVSLVKQHARFSPYYLPAQGFMHPARQEFMEGSVQPSLNLWWRDSPSLTAAFRRRLGEAKSFEAAHADHREPMGFRYGQTMGGGGKGNTAIAALEDAETKKKVEDILTKAKEAEPEDQVKRQTLMMQELLPLAKSVVGDSWKDWGVTEDNAMMVMMQAQGDELLPRPGWCLKVQRPPPPFSMRASASLRRNSYRGSALPVTQQPSVASLRSLPSEKPEGSSLKNLETLVTENGVLEFPETDMEDDALQAAVQTMKRHKTITFEDIALSEGVKQSVYLDYLKWEIDTESAFLELPLTIVVLISFAMLAMNILHQEQLYTMETAIERDIIENANFAWSGHFGHKGILQVHSIADFWSWMRLGFLGLVVKPGWLYSEPAPDILGGPDMTSRPDMPTAWLFNGYERPAPVANDARREMFRMGWALETELQIRKADDADVFCHKMSRSWDMEDGCAYSNATGNACRCEWCSAGAQSLRPWIDEETSRVEISMVVYNAQYGSYTYVSVNFMFNRGGHIHSFIHCLSAFVNPFLRPGPELALTLVAATLWIGALLYALAAELTEIRGAIRNSNAGLRKALWEEHDVWDYVGFYNMVDWSSIIVGSLAIGYYFQSRIAASAVNELLPSMIDASLKPDANYQSTVKEFFRAAEDMSKAKKDTELQLMFYPLIIMMRLFRSFEAQPRLALVSATLKTAPDLGHFFMIFLCVYLCFVVSSLLFFGQDLESFSTMDRALHTSFLAMFGDWDWNAMTDVGMLRAAVWFWVFMVMMVLFMLNMLLAIIMDAYQMEKYKTSDATTLWQQILDMIERRRQYIRGERVRLTDVWKTFRRQYAGKEKAMLSSDQLLSVEYLVNTVTRMPEQQALRTMVHSLKRDDILTHGFMTEEQVNKHVEKTLGSMELKIKAILEDVEFINDKLDFFDRLLAPGDAEYDFYFGADGQSHDQASRLWIYNSITAISEELQQNFVRGIQRIGTWQDEFECEFMFTLCERRTERRRLRLGSQGEWKDISVA